MERRQFERFQRNNFATYKLHHFSAGVECVTNNISLKGACVLTEKKLKPKKNIKLKLFLGPKLGPRETNSRVVYSKPTDGNLGKGYLSGLEFLDIIFKDEKELSDNEY